MERLEQKKLFQGVFKAFLVPKLSHALTYLKEIQTLCLENKTVLDRLHSSQDMTISITGTLSKGLLLSFTTSITSQSSLTDSSSTLSTPSVTHSFQLDQPFLLTSIIKSRQSASQAMIALKEAVDESAYTTASHTSSALQRCLMHLEEVESVAQDSSILPIRLLHIDTTNESSKNRADRQYTPHPASPTHTKNIPSDVSIGDVPGDDPSDPPPTLTLRHRGGFLVLSVTRQERERVSGRRSFRIRGGRSPLVQPTMELDCGVETLAGVLERVDRVKDLVQNALVELKSLPIDI
eukprot:gnl/Dysnectes_brevis/2243_a2624_989.p2 GENE.gnl/Dysnectes_brevis/2243_a2624_989~~gnl/Dysnectes_brevis/2243_a2624_989.p2  ORF type:complete len:293 (-),score=50.77 gnl/Dysnectes_brevis/2243_a2624_989:81-959(-)